MQPKLMVKINGRVGLSKQAADAPKPELRLGFTMCPVQPDGPKRTQAEFRQPKKSRLILFILKTLKNTNAQKIQKNKINSGKLFPDM